MSPSSRSAGSKGRAGTTRGGRSKSAGPRILVVGFGRMGGALGLALKRAGYAVAALPRSGGSIRAAAALGVRLADPEWMASCDLCFLTVPDQAIPEVAKMLLPDLGPRTALVHCAGSKDLSAFGRPAKTRRRGSFHPLCAVSDRRDHLSGHTVALTASDPKVLRQLQALARDLHLHPITVPESGRASYHAGAVLSAGGVVALASAAVAALEVAGVDPDEALTALLPLMRSAIEGLERRGLPGSLTGPIARGDVPTVGAHLKALPKRLVPLYRELSALALGLAEDQLEPETRKALRAKLDSTKST